MIQKAQFIQTKIRVTQSRYNPNINDSHYDRNAVDFALAKVGGDTNVYAPYDCVVVEIQGRDGGKYEERTLGDSDNAILIESVEPVESPSGKIARQWMIVCHTNDFRDNVIDSWQNGTVIPKGAKFYSEGTYGSGSENGVPAHIHVQCGWLEYPSGVKGEYIGWKEYPELWRSKGSNIEDCLFASRNVQISDEDVNNS